MSNNTEKKRIPKASVLYAAITIIFVVAIVLAFSGKLGNGTYSKIGDGTDNAVGKNLSRKSSTITFESKAGYTIQLPEVYRYEVGFRDRTDGTSFYVDRCMKDAGGLLFAIMRVKGEDEVEELCSMMDDSKVLYHDKNIYYVIGRPTDVEYTTDTEDFYYEMASYYDQIIASFKVKGAKSLPKGEYILPDSDSVYLEEADLSRLTADECRLARNEIYARHGKIFNDQELQKHFEECSWYTPVSKDVPDSMLSKIEIENVKLIVEYEKKMGYR